MPGRQAHGRPLISAPAAPKSVKKSKTKARATALDAFGIASKQFPTKEKRTPRFREIEADLSQKHRRVDDDEEGEEDEDEEPKRKRAKASGGDSDVEYGSDSEGNEWQYGVDEDNDSEIDSDEAFGDSDEEVFQGYTVGGTKAKSAKKSQDSDDDDEGDDDDSLGEDAIDLAQALDEADDESVEEGGSDVSESEDDGATSPPSSDEESEADEETDTTKLDALQTFISEFGGTGGKDAIPDGGSKQRQKIGIKDLGLFGVKDPHMKKSLKLMSKEEKEKRPGITKKLEVPLARRQQDKLLRSAAYEKANETLGRWTETVKHNRRAEHLIFPLPQNAADAGLDNSELQPLTAKKSTSELEQTILSIMEQSGLALSKSNEPKKRQDGDEDQEAISRAGRKELQNQRRLERELISREGKRLKRIKKIKSKSYHRVHRKQREREELAIKEAMELEGGGVDSEEERETHDRRRALERVGARHRDSKWAKSGAATKRAVWDDDFRAGMHDMARKEEELRKRKEGRAAAGSDDSESDEFSGSDAGDRNLRAQLDRLARDDEDGPEESGLMQMKFMKRAEEALKKSNDELISQIRKDLGSGDEEAESEDEGAEIGRKQFGIAKPTLSMPSLTPQSRKKALLESDLASGLVPSTLDGSKLNIGYSVTASESNPTAGAWSQGEKRRKSRKHQPSTAEALDLTAAILVAERPKSKPKAKVSASQAEPDIGSDSDSDLHLPLALRDQELVARAFAGDDVVVDFDREKAVVADEDDDKIVDDTLPGWNSWVGEGVSSREKKRHTGRFLTKVEGVKKKDRKDTKLERVIISEKRTKKNDRYLASQLPYPFESKAQYERTLRLPVGKEWMTKETFQDSTKPRILVKQGIIAPMSKPIV